MRLNIIRHSILVLFLLILGNLFYLQVIRGGYYAHLGLSNSIRVVPFEGARGRILDRNGKLLAQNTKAYHAVVVPQDIRDKRALFAFMADVLGVETAVVEKRFLKNKLTKFAPVTLADNLKRSQVIMIEENAFRFPGLMVLEKFSRHYPSGDSAAHLVGYVGKADPFKMNRITEYGFSAEDVVGYSGVEEYYDAVLRGQPGGRQIEVNSRGQQTQLLSVREPVDGTSLTLTVDRDIQRSAQEALSGRRGAVVVMVPASGEVLAVVSSPSFNPNAFISKEDREPVAQYLQDPAAPLHNRAVSGAFPPGSVFKIPVSLGGLEERKIIPATTYDCPGYFQMGDRTYRFPHAWGAQDLTRALAHSANEYFFHIGLLLGSDGMGKYARAFGLGSRTGIDLPSESKGSLPGLNVGRWYKGDTLNMSIGQGYVLATPIQLARLMSAFENSGNMPRPYIVLSGLAEPVKTQFTHVSFRPEVWAAVRAGLAEVVSLDTGTAHALADIPGAVTYGKTGTAQAGAGKEDHAWFAGVTRTDKSVIAYCVFLEHGGSSANAVALTKELLTALRDQGKI
ncbi:MAG: penicillin-binding protein 2 [Candidatus Omnitrophica bacterium]|nr:penicillin-binding protein 2 [Candidatus Omnitrophota bacterium]